MMKSPQHGHLADAPKFIVYSMSAIQVNFCDHETVRKGFDGMGIYEIETDESEIIPKIVSMRKREYYKDAVEYELETGNFQYDDFGTAYLKRENGNIRYFLLIVDG